MQNTNWTVAADVKTDADLYKTLLSLIALSLFPVSISTYEKSTGGYAYAKRVQTTKWGVEWSFQSGDSRQHPLNQGIFDFFYFLPDIYIKLQQCCGDNGNR